MSDSFAEITSSLVIPGATGIYVQKRDSRIRALDVFAAVKVDSGLEALLVKADPRLLPSPDEWPASEGFHIEVRNLGLAAQSSSLLCLELTSDQFREVFMSLAEDVCGVIMEQADAADAIKAMFTRLFRWQAFLRKHRGNELSDEARVGLFGELTVLETMLLEELDDRDALRSWRGYTGASKDFQIPGMALEVKATRAVTPDKVGISNINQLDDDGLDHMFLVIVSIEQNEAVGRSLPEIVADLRRSLGGADLDVFNEGLIEVGYMDVHQKLYQRALYQVKGMTCYRVSEGFPRLVTKNVPDGVKQVRYQISLDACSVYDIDPEEIRKVLESYANN